MASGNNQINNQNVKASYMISPDKFLNFQKKNYAVYSCYKVLELPGNLCPE